MISQHWFKYWLGAIMHQAINWTNIDPVLCCHVASPFTRPQLVKFVIVLEYICILLQTTMIYFSSMHCFNVKKLYHTTYCHIQSLHTVNENYMKPHLDFISNFMYDNVKWMESFPSLSSLHRIFIQLRQPRIWCCHYLPPGSLIARGHPSLFHTATSLLIWYKMFCVRDIS